MYLLGQPHIDQFISPIDNGRCNGQGGVTQGFYHRNKARDQNGGSHAAKSIGWEFHEIIQQHNLEIPQNR